MLVVLILRFTWIGKEISTRSLSLRSWMMICFVRMWFLSWVEEHHCGMKAWRIKGLVRVKKSSTIPAIRGRLTLRSLCILSSLFICLHFSCFPSLFTRLVFSPIPHIKQRQRKTSTNLWYVSCNININNYPKLLKLVPWFLFITIFNEICDTYWHCNILHYFDITISTKPSWILCMLMILWALERPSSLILLPHRRHSHPPSIMEVAQNSKVNGKVNWQLRVFFVICHFLLGEMSL